MRKKNNKMQEQTKSRQTLQTKEDLLMGNPEHYSYDISNSKGFGR